MNDVSYQLDPIGRVEIDETGFSIVIAERFRPALKGLEGFSHLDVLFWCHHLDTPEYRKMVVVDKPYKQGPEQVGIFATRSPARPNPIALTAAAVLGIDVEQGIIRIAYLDADAGTPVLDIKPYLPAIDRVRTVDVPDWCADWPSWSEDSANFDWAAVFENAR